MEFISLCNRTYFQNCNQSLIRRFGKERSVRWGYSLFIGVFTTMLTFFVFFLSIISNLKIQFNSWMDEFMSDSLSCNWSVKILASFSFSLSIMFILLIIIILIKCQYSKTINQNFFILKIIFVIGVFIGFIYFPTNATEIYLIIAKYVSILYMIGQSLIIMDFFYYIGNKYGKHSNVKDMWKQILFIIFCEIVAIFMNVYGFQKFFNVENKERSDVILIMNGISSAILFGLVLIGLAQKYSLKGMITSSLVSVYVSYLSFIAQFSHPYYSQSINQGYNGDIIICLFWYILTFYSLVMNRKVKMKRKKYNILRRLIKLSQKKLIGSGDINNNNQIVVSNPINPQSNQQIVHVQTIQHISQQQTVESVNVAIQQKKKKENKIQQWKWISWHLVMLISSIYLPILLTSWNISSIKNQQIQSNVQTYWIRICIIFVMTVWYFYYDFMAI